MKLDLSTWKEVEAYLKRSKGIIIPTGSMEQHGPIGLIGTDALCAEIIARQVGEKLDALVAPTLNYTPAPFNLAFPGTISVQESTYRAILQDMIASLMGQGFEQVYFLNAHGANLAPLKDVCAGFDAAKFRIKSWWDFEAVNELRHSYYGDWEGMHATPSEVAITQAAYRVVSSLEAEDPPIKLSADYIKAHAGDKHGPADQHRASFPDGRVGSHSALARPEHGEALIKAAVASIADDYSAWLGT